MSLLANKVAVVTGAGRGIGRAVALGFFDGDVELWIRRQADTVVVGLDLFVALSAGKGSTFYMPLSSEGNL